MNATNTLKVILNGTTMEVAVKATVQTPAGYHYWAVQVGEPGCPAIYAQSQLGPGTYFDALGWLKSKLPEIETRMKEFGIWRMNIPMLQE